MSFLSKLLLKKREQVKDAYVTIIGPPKAGKTTLVRYLETGKPVEEELSTTLGIEVRKTGVQIDQWRLRAIDTGGQKIYQQTFWELAVQQADVVIFLIDATIKPDTNPELYELTKEQFSYALDIIPEDVPLLVLINKQDLKEKNPMNVDEALQILDFGSIPNRSMAFYPCSAKYGTGVEEAINWIVTQLDSQKR